MKILLIVLRLVLGAAAVCSAALPRVVLECVTEVDC